MSLGKLPLNRSTKTIHKNKTYNFKPSRIKTIESPLSTLYKLSKIWLSLVIDILFVQFFGFVKLSLP